MGAKVKKSPEGGLANPTFFKHTARYPARHVKPYGARYPTRHTAQEGAPDGAPIDLTERPQSNSLQAGRRILPPTQKPLATGD